MVSWLELQGLKSVHKKTLQTIWAAAAHVEGHITRELERYMSTLSESITRLVQAVNTEFDQIRREAQAAVDAAKAALEQVGSENVELQSKLQEQVSKNEALITSIDDARGRLDAISGELEGNDPHPDNELPGAGSAGGEHPDNTLPGAGSAGGEHPDNTLPTGGDANTGGDHVDNTLPGQEPGNPEDQPHPDQTLPGDLPQGRSGRGGRKYGTHVHRVQGQAADCNARTRLLAAGRCCIPQ
jgi:hypothetical protein